MNSTGPKTVSFVEQYFAEVQSIADQIDTDKINAIAHELATLRNNGGRLFFLGVGVALVTLRTQSMISGSFVGLNPTPQPITLLS